MGAKAPADAEVCSSEDDVLHWCSCVRQTKHNNFRESGMRIVFNFHLEPTCRIVTMLDLELLLGVRLTDYGVATPTSY
jgi:hypothetical protein